MTIDKDKIRKKIYSSKKYRSEIEASRDPCNKSSEVLRNEIKKRIKRLSEQINDMEDEKSNRYKRLLSSVFSSMSSEDLAKYVFFPSAKHSIPPLGGMENVVRRNKNADLKNFQEIQYRLFDDFGMNVDNETFIPKDEDEFIQFLSLNLDSATNKFYKHHLKFIIDYFQNIRCKLKNPIFIKEVFPPEKTALLNIYISCLEEYLQYSLNTLYLDFDSVLYAFSPYDLFEDLWLNSANEICHNFCKHIDLICFNTPELLEEFKNNFISIKNNMEEEISYIQHNIKFEDFDHPYTHEEAFITLCNRNIIFENLSFLSFDLKSYKKDFDKITSTKEKNKYIQFLNHYYEKPVKTSKTSSTFTDNLNHIKEFINLYPFDEIYHDNNNIPYINLFIQKNEEALEKILCYEFYILDSEHVKHKIHKNTCCRLSTMNLIKTINDILNNTNTFDLYNIEEKDYINNDNNTVKYALHLLFTEKIRRGFYRENEKIELYQHNFELRKELNFLLAEIFSICDIEIQFMLILELNEKLNGIFLDYFENIETLNK